MSRMIYMSREYKYHCNGCRKPDKDFPLRFQDYEVGEEIYNCPPVTEHRWARCDAYGIYTGIYCDECYDSDDSDKYPYRKDDYAPDLEHGEHIYSEEERSN